MNVAGDFNDWSAEAAPLSLQGPGEFAGTVNLSPGVHQYKFVIDGKDWVKDPASDRELEESDGYGGTNSAVLVGPDGRHLPPPEPGRIRLMTIKHQPRQDATLVARGVMRLNLRAQAQELDDVQALVLGDSKKTENSGTAAGEPHWRPVTLYKVGTKWGYDRFTALVSPPPTASTADRGMGGLMTYIFAVHKAGVKPYYLASGRAYRDLTAAQAVAYQAPLATSFETPEWAKHAIWYQIFPERFCNGEAANDPPNTKPWTHAWFAKLPGESGKFYNDVWGRRYGGDFQGIMKKLPYLRELGITAIYLNPIFKGEDLHKYDTADYRHVDDNFGFKGDIAELAAQGVETDDPATWRWTKTDQLFLDFVQEAHRQGFKVVIDGVFNHVGRAHYMFQDVLKKGRKSAYADWFDIRDWGGGGGGKGKPIQYIAWDRGSTPSSDGALPVFKKSPQTGLVDGPRQHIIAITKRWLAPDGDSSRG
ncbi:MAG: alpha-amylase family glycosyl hydrolase, partial [Phycisphaerae bacterium]